MYLNVFECIYSILMVHFNVFIIHLNAFIVCFNVFHCISMCLNVFNDIVIGILPSHSHCNVFTMHTHLHIFFPLYTMTPFLACYTTTLFFFHSHWFVPTFIQSMKKLHIIHHPTFLVPHATFHVITVCAEHSGAQVFILEFNFYFYLIFFENRIY
jgi:hypothetical protein